MPRRFIVGRNVNHFLDRPEDLYLPMEARRDRVRFFAQKAIHRHRLPAPVRRLDARGPYVPAPSLQSRGAIVKIWPASASTTAAHSRYLTCGKGVDGTDAPLFDAQSLGVDRQAFAQRAASGPHQFRWPLIKDERLPRAHPHHYRPAGIEATGRRWGEVTEGCPCTTGVCRREPG